MKNIYLVGFMGTGKSAVAKALGKMTGKEYLELDEKIVEQEGCSIADLFATQGEEYFRRVETECLRELKGAGKIISCGGGTVLRPENAEEMKENGRVFLLTATAETIYERIKQTTDRPVLAGRMDVASIQEILEQRKEAYSQAAKECIVTDNRTVKQIAQEIVAKAPEFFAK